MTHKVSICIKALNEAEHINGAIESALRAQAPFDGEVILADSGSTDETVAIARRYPITIVQLNKISDQSCGAGGQLAFQHSSGEYIYLMDGDMHLHADFIATAIAYLDAHGDVGAVGGTVVERRLANLEFKVRQKALHREQHQREGFVDRLNGGGLYRRKAIADVGYFTDRNLHGFEEYELGARLTKHGWGIVRLPRTAVDHFGYTMNAYSLLWKRITSKYAYAGGEVIRASLARKHFLYSVKHFSHIRQWAVVIGWWLCFLLAVIFLQGTKLLLGLLIMLLMPIIFLSIRRGSITTGIYSLISWNVSTFGALIGVWRGRQPPDEPISSLVIQRR